MKTQRIDNNCSVVLKRLVILLTLLLFTALLVACGGSKSAIVGKWEVVETGEGGGMMTAFLVGDGQTIEFTKDGTVIFSISFFGTQDMAADYSWLDKSRLKIGGGQLAQAGSSIVFDVELQDDNLFLRDSNGALVAHLQRYAELAPSPETLAGSWESQGDTADHCFTAFDPEYVPNTLIFGKDGSFTVAEGTDFIIGNNSLRLDGQYMIQDNHLHIEASGNRHTESLLNDAKDEAISGTSDCEITLTHSRLTFRDDQGQTMLYVRAQR